jgi:DNA-directed RNA polymerase subunit RPC12/RpoP
MADTVEVECGFCRKPFRLKPEQLNHQVRCPHCKTAMKMRARTETALAAAEALRQPAPRRSAGAPHAGLGSHAAPGRRTGPGQRPLPSPKSRNQTVVILSAVAVVVVLIGLSIGLWATFKRPDAPTPASSSELGRPAARHSGDQASGETAPGAPAPAAPGAILVPAAPGTAPAPAAEPIAIKVERLLSGFRDGTITYAVGRVTNNTDNPILVLKVIVPITDSSGTALGEAVAMILNLPPKTTVPLVAEWVHAEDVRGKKFDVRFEVNPTGVTRDLPPLSTDDVLPWPDPNALSLAGVVKSRVTNLGLVPVGTIDAVAILVGADGKIVGCARNILTKEIKPRKSQDITIRWDHCSKSLVNTAEVWVQPAL